MSWKIWILLVTLKRLVDQVLISFKNLRISVMSRFQGVPSKSIKKVLRLWSILLWPLLFQKLKGSVWIYRLSCRKTRVFDFKRTLSSSRACIDWQTRGRVDQLLDGVYCLPLSYILSFLSLMMIWVFRLWGLIRFYTCSLTERLFLFLIRLYLLFGKVLLCKFHFFVDIEKSWFWSFYWMSSSWSLI